MMVFDKNSKIYAVNAAYVLQSLLENEARTAVENVTVDVTVNIGNFATSEGAATAVFELSWTVISDYII